MDDFYEFFRMDAMNKLRVFEDMLKNKRFI